MPVIGSILHTRTGAHEIGVRTAAGFFTRFAGLMLTKPLQPHIALLLTNCRSVHTAFMRYAIDVVYVDECGIVLKCVARVKPWHASSIGRKARSGVRAIHTLEFTAGAIDRFDIRAGDRLQHPLLKSADAARPVQKPDAKMPRSLASRQRGAAMLEFVVVGPMVTMIGLSLVQYGMLFFAKNQINHAAFMAARAGAMGNARVETIRNAYVDALVPLYGGGLDANELAAAQARVEADLIDRGLLNIEMMNPTRESFDDWNEPGLQNTIGSGRRVIPNSSLALRDPNAIGANSGQSIQDANLIKLRVTHGYEPKVPLAGTIYNRYLRWLDNGTDPHYTAIVGAGRIPVVSHVTLNMHTDAIEPENPVSIPGPGNNGNPSNPGDPPPPREAPPNCLTMGRTVEGPPAVPGDPGGGGGDNPGEPPCL